MLDLLEGYIIDLGSYLIFSNIKSFNCRAPPSNI
jgi:hypothetical protein